MCFFLFIWKGGVIILKDFYKGDLFLKILKILDSNYCRGYVILVSNLCERIKGYDLELNIVSK